MRALVMVVGITVIAFAASACGSEHHPRASTPTTSAASPLASDPWKPPVVAGPPSTAKFCTLLVADYDHLGTNPRAANLKVRQQIIGDFISFTPTVIAAAPTPIAAAAATYLGGITQILTILNAAGLNAAKTPQGSIGMILLDPQVSAASTQVLSFAQQNCHYNI
ncbi:MAG: hypothetical protein M3137_04030, partial [Actinomycetota bacterium]|nr:hypothetical protein [Actinomycetota bacterium]